LVGGVSSKPSSLTLATKDDSVGLSLSLNSANEGRLAPIAKPEGRLCKS
jgi:hypothetical protein